MRGRTERQGNMMAFFGWFVHYLLIFVFLAAVAGIGIFAGKKLSDRKAAAAGDAAHTEEVK